MLLFSIMRKIDAAGTSVELLSELLALLLADKHGLHISYA